MSGDANQLFLVCAICHAAGRPEYGIRIAGRTSRGWYDPDTPPKQLKNWFAKHSKCAPRHQPDHFKLAYAFAQNHDWSERTGPHLAVVPSTPQETTCNSPDQPEPAAAG